MGDKSTGKNSHHYIQRLGLKADPFEASYRSDYFYEGAARRQIVEQLVHFSRYSNRVVILVGATGSGTSTLLAKAGEELETLLDCCEIDAEQATTPEQLLATLAEQLQLIVPTPASSEAIVASLQSVAMVDGQPEPVQLLVDQAHFLPLESYAVLQDLAAMTQGKIRLLLAGEYQVEQLAGLVGFSSDDIQLLEIEPLQRAETEAYILGLLQSAGYAGNDQPLNDYQLKQLQERTGGNIAEIEQQLPALLQAEYPPPTSLVPFKLPIPITHIVTILVLVGVIAIASWYQRDDPSERVRVESVQLDLEANEGSKAKQPLPPTDTAPSHNTRIDGGAIVGGAVARVVASSSEGPGVAPEQIPALAEDAPSLDAESSAGNVALDEEPVAVTIAQELKPEVSGLKPLDPPVGQKLPQVERAKPSPLPTPTVTPRERRLLSLPATAYMLQLLGTVDEKKAAGFVQKYADRLPITYFSSRLNGKPLFVVVAGPFDNKQAASDAKGTLPAELRDLNPWPKGITSIQQAILRNQP